MYGKDYPKQLRLNDLYRLSFSQYAMQVSYPR